MPDLPNRQEREKRLAAAIFLLLSRQGKAFTSGTFDLASFETAAAEASYPELIATYEQAARELAKAQGTTLDAATLRAQAEEWADKTSQELAAGMADTTKQAIADAKAGGATLAASALTIFGRSRADAIGATETTGAISAGEQPAVAQYEIETGNELEPIWQTEEDDAVCPICRPFDGKPSEFWSDDFPNGPPGHPNCRCWLEWEPV